MSDCYDKTWYLFGVIPVWRVQRTLTDEELRKRVEELGEEIFAAKDGLADRVKESVLEDISRAWNEAEGEFKQNKQHAS